MQAISITLKVSKLVIFRLINFSQPSNIERILVTFLVLKLEMFKEAKESHPLNMQYISVDSLVSRTSIPLISSRH